MAPPPLPSSSTPSSPVTWVTRRAPHPLSLRQGLRILPPDALQTGSLIGSIIPPPRSTHLLRRSLHIFFSRGALYKLVLPLRVPDLLAPAATPCPTAPSGFAHFRRAVPIRASTAFTAFSSHRPLSHACHAHTHAPLVFEPARSEATSASRAGLRQPKGDSLPRGQFVDERARPLRRHHAQGLPRRLLPDARIHHHHIHHRRTAAKLWYARSA
eukprot:1985095-Pleurochrysis_carterae.AAC.1